MSAATDPGTDDGGAAALMRSAAVRDLDSEGIPVVLALAASGRPALPARDPGARADGAALAVRAQQLRDQLWPESRDGDLFTTYAVLATLARAEIDGR